MGKQRRKYTDDYKASAVERLYEPGATQGSVSNELGITGTQLKTWRLEIEAFGSIEAKRRQKADAAELVRLRKDNKRLAEDVEIWRNRWETRRQAEEAIFQYINGFYNPRRRHSSLGGKSPLAFERKAA